MAAVLLSSLMAAGMVVCQVEPLPAQEEAGEPQPGVMLPGVQDPEPPATSPAPQDADNTQDAVVEPAVETETTPDPTSPGAPPAPREPPVGVGPPVWRGVAWGSAVALAIAVPGVLLGLGLGALASLSTLGMGLMGFTLVPLFLVGVLVGALGTGCCWGTGAFALFGAIPGGLVAGVATMLGAAHTSKRKMPWVPTLLATTVPRAVGGVIGLGVGLATLWFGSLLLSVVSQGLFATMRQNVVGTLVVFWAAYAALMLTVPALVLLGTMLGDLLGVLVVTNAINPRLSRDIPPGEDSIPTALFLSATRWSHWTEFSLRLRVLHGG